MHVTNTIISGSPLLPIFGAIGAIVAAIVAARVALRMHRQTQLVQMVTAERATWRAELRNEMASLSGTIMTGLGKGEINATTFHKARVGILLRVNPAGRKEKQPIVGGHNLDKTIDACLRRLARAVAMKSEAIMIAGTRDCIRRDLEQLEHAVQELLKQEWEGSKEEAITGRLKRRTVAQ